MFSAIRMARNIICAEKNINNVLCIGADVLPKNSKREILYNVISDGAAGVVVSRDCKRGKILDCHQLSKGYYWDPIQRRTEIIAAYYPAASQVIEEILAKNEIDADDLGYFIPSGISQASWKVLLEIVKIPQTKMYTKIPGFGHTILADNVIYLENMRKDQEIKLGEKLLLYSYGFGSNWSTLLLEH
jgi:3-oxoacyl-[acyl-carrier-protein] synthase-3